MLSTGQIIRACGNVLGKPEALLDNGARYLIDNDEEMPLSATCGLFEYAEQDQFCRWVGMNEIDLKYC